MRIVSTHSTVKTLGIALIAMALVFAFSATLKAEPSTVRYLDETAGFVLLDQIASDVKDGDRVCVFEANVPTPTCDVTFRWMTRNPIIFPKKELFERLEIGTVLEIKKILFGAKAGDAPTDVSAFNKERLKGQEKDKELDQTKTMAKANKFPKGAPPDVSVEAPSIEGDEFPDIFIPKMRKTKKKSKRAVSELAGTIKAIKKALKDKGLVSYSFTADPDVEDVVPSAVREDYPNPLHGAVEISVLEAVPLLPMASYQSLGFKTITNQTVNRSTLWNPSKNKLTPSAGGGIEIQIAAKQSGFVNIGWRYHTYNSLKSHSTYDEFDTTLVANSVSTVGEQIVSTDWGKRQSWTDNFFTSYAFGSDLAYTNVNFQSKVDGNGTTAPFIVATARHNFMTLAPRTQLRMGVQRWGLAFSTGLWVIVPAYNFADTFNGEVAKPDRVIFKGDITKDLQNSLAQQKNPVSAEIFISISYSPQRK